MRSMILFPMFAACVLAPVLTAQKNASSCPGDACAFLEAQNLSYNGYHKGHYSYEAYHPGAREMFRQYKSVHPDDFLSVIRMDYDYLFDVNASPAEYAALLQDVDTAIARFEALKYAGTPCAGTDLKGIARGALDCNYIGAALYSFREAIRIKKDGKFADWNANGVDDRQFFSYARTSASAGCIQAKFLLAVHEYEAGNATLAGIPHIIPWVLRTKGVPADRDDAVRKLAHALAANDQSPFADDIRFYVLRIELQHKYGAEELSKEFPPAALIAQLQPKYPHNRMFEDGLESFSDTYEDH